MALICLQQMLAMTSPIIHYPALFASDLHGHVSRYVKLFQSILEERPSFVFLGGDLLPHGLKRMEGIADFTRHYLIPGMHKLREIMGRDYPDIFVILGNDDMRSEESKFIQADREGLVHYLNNTVFDTGSIQVFGYPFVPPTPFRLKDWDKYDTGVVIPPGCLSPLAGTRSTIPDYDPGSATIAGDLEKLPLELNFSRTVMIFHSPPYGTRLDVAGPDPPGIHIGSLAIRHFIDQFRPLLTLHGHVHESSRLSGSWMEQIGNTVSCNAGHDGPELCLIKFPNILNPREVSRVLK